MRPVFFQNLQGGSGGGSFSPSSVVLSVTSSNSIVPMYHDGTHYVNGQWSHLLNLENISNNLRLSYSYLGGTHFGNYAVSSRRLGDKRRFEFTLRKAFDHGEEVWDIPNAAFWTWEKGPASFPTKAPIHKLSIDVDINTGEGTIADVKTLLDSWISATGSSLVNLCLWFPEEEGLNKCKAMSFAYNSSTGKYDQALLVVNLTLETIASSLFGNEYPSYCSWGIQGTGLVNPFLAWWWGWDQVGTSTRTFRVEAALSYENSFDLNTRGAQGQLIKYDFTNGCTGPYSGSANYITLEP